VINKDQILINVLKTGFEPTTQFSSAYEERESSKQVMQLGKVLRDACEKVHGGILLFFPSYYLLN
jgi:Rad3-related DNA helicase